MSMTNGTAEVPPSPVWIRAVQAAEAAKRARRSVGPINQATAEWRLASSRALLRGAIAAWRLEDPEGCAAYMASLQRRADATS